MDIPSLISCRLLGKGHKTTRSPTQHYPLGPFGGPGLSRK